MPEQQEKPTFIQQLERLVNAHSVERESNTPDFILAKYMCACLTAFATATKDRAKYYGTDPSIVDQLNGDADELYDTMVQD
jgi:hypothetical protein